MGHLFGMVTPGDVGRKPLGRDLQTLIVLMDCLAQEAHGTRIPVSLSDVQVRKRVALSESTCPLSQTPLRLISASRIETPVPSRMQWKTNPTQREE